MADECGWYCENCEKNMADEGAKALDDNGNAHCSHECADEANFDIQRDQ